MDPENAAVEAPDGTAVDPWDPVPGAAADSWAALRMLGTVTVHTVRNSAGMTS
jgi:hypothetical protein